jgi:hypothetical protein
MLRIIYLVERIDYLLHKRYLPGTRRSTYEAGCVFMGIGMLYMGF